jgi:hypothetical protein
MNKDKYFRMGRQTGKTNTVNHYMIAPLVFETALNGLDKLAEDARAEGNEQFAQGISYAKSCVISSIEAIAKEMKAVLDYDEYVQEEEDEQTN